MKLESAISSLEYGCIISNKDINNSFKGPVTDKLIDELKAINDNGNVDKLGWFLVPKIIKTKINK